MSKNITKGIKLNQLPVIDEELEQKYINGAGVLSTPQEIHLILLSNKIRSGTPLNISRKAELDIILTPETAEEIGQLLIDEAQKYKSKRKED